MGRTISFEALATLGEGLSQLDELSEKMAATLARIRVAEEWARTHYKEEKEYLRLSDAARLLGVNATTICRYDKAGILPFYYLPGNKHKVYKRSDVLAIPQLSQEAADALVPEALRWWEKKEA